MRKLILSAVLACAPLAACELPPPVPASVANSTLLDEQVGQGVELAYAAFRSALELAVDTGRLKGTAASRAAELDNRAYAAVNAVRAAYRTGNATSYAAAARDARLAITDALMSIKGK